MVTLLECFLLGIPVLLSSPTTIQGVVVSSCDGCGLVSSGLFCL